MEPELNSGVTVTTTPIPPHTFGPGQPRNRAERRQREREQARLDKPAGHRKWCASCDKYHRTTA